MHLVLVGLSHHHAPIEVRERFSYPEHVLPGALRAVLSCPGIREAAILSTCNRTELYALVSAPEQSGAFAALRQLLSQYHAVPEPAFAPYLYCKAEHEAALHLTRVASGLDSLVLGEAQILGQVRTALRFAQAEGAAGSAIHALFQQAMTGGKRVQSETDLRRGSLSIGHVAVELASRIFGNLKNASALILGAGKMSELTAKDLVSNGVKFVVVANRTYEKAVELAERLDGKAIRYDSFLDALLTADIVIASTASPHPILTREMLNPVVRKRRGKPLFIIDIAVPRDVDPDVANLENVFLYNIDDLQEVAAEGARGRAETAKTQAEQIALEEAARFLTRYRTRAVAPIISELRSQLDGMAKSRLEILRSRLGDLPERDWKIIATQLESLASEVALQPILRLKAEASKSSATQEETLHYDLATAARELFGLKEGSEKEEAEKVVLPQNEYLESIVRSSGDSLPTSLLDSELAEALQ